ncbi:hypothetical protein AB37_2151 [Escherichia coli 8-415-05_S1_C2]|nr:hypothetical protein AB09_2118 [Escherichia coli 8-415-05_S1_C1]KEO10081.1 hypothetical protein AB37_2151 [Escherichia coli 8-415-05_S1_C2]
MNKTLAILLFSVSFSAYADINLYGSSATWVEIFMPVDSLPSA